MSTAVRKYRKDYQVPAYWFDEVHLSFDIYADHTDVVATSTIRKNPESELAQLDLDGRELELLAVEFDGQTLSKDQYNVGPLGMTLQHLPAAGQLTITTRIYPDKNLSLEGLYRSGDLLCTQCEATGFSRITYFPDRPDVMARYTTRVEADKATFPILLSNGNCIEQGAAEAGRHFAVYEDPFAKPCYLFALVAGDLGMIQDTYTTKSGREIDLRLYTEHGNEGQCGHAMHSLKQAMAWDEKTYNLEYDLDSYVTVAVGSFNMGAMENKGLNIFNTACVFAHKDTATDDDFDRVRDVVAHEYFHNYTGNRVTCRDWFQLSLKEGLTVYREHQFSIDHGSPGTARIGQVRIIREAQFAEDASPRAHPVRPESYVEMDNFYTVTVYHKGAELVRMIAEIAGREAFLQAVQYYLQKHDGQACTIEDFVVAMEESTGADLRQFRRWYEQAGTPEVTIKRQYDAQKQRLILNTAQHLAATDQQPQTQLLDIPVALQLIDATGKKLGAPEVLRLQDNSQCWTFNNVAQEPALSVLRGFSAPVKLKIERDTTELAHLMAYDDDPVARWDAAQQLYLDTLVADASARQAETTPIAAPQALFDAVSTLLANPPRDKALLAEMLMLPSIARICEEFAEIDIHAIVAARDSLKQQLAQTFQNELVQLFEAHAAQGVYEFNVAEAGRRKIQGVALSLLAALGRDVVAERAQQLYQQADNMTDQMNALNAIRDINGAERDAMLDAFANRWAQEPLVMDKWLRLQVSSRGQDAVHTIEKLLKDEHFDWHNPNRIRALLAGFVRGNPSAFHRFDGAGYGLLSREIKRIDAFNPQMAASLTTLLASWQRYEPEQGEGMRSELERLYNQEISSNTREVVETALGE